MASILRSSANVRSFPRCYAARSFSVSARVRASEKPFFPDEPTGPKLVTSIPGPKNKAAAAELDEVFDIRSLNMFADYNKSIGN